MTNIGQGYISFEMILMAISTIVTSALFMKYSDRIFRWYPIMCLIDVFVFGALIALVAIGKIPVTSYFLARVIICATVCKLMGSSVVHMARLVYTDAHEREQYDHSGRIVNAAFCVIGGLIGSVLGLTAGWIMFGFSVVIDDVIFYCVYRKVTKK